ncbi:MAG: PSP1 domain-containing protein [Candidatus Villigracilaceae bacterium]
MQPIIIGVRFKKNGKVYHFDSSSVPNVQPGDHVVVDTARGKHLGEVIQVFSEPPLPPEGGWKNVERRATPRDLVLRQTWERRQTEALINCRARAAELGLTSIKIVAAEFNFDGSRLAFLFSTETDDKIELKSLRNDMQKLYPQAQVELRQIGPRDVAKILGGMGACGIETRCCSRFLTDFSPISIKMAKEQGISLTPSEITGMCGRLRCCLVYEFEQYVEAYKNLPKRGKIVVTPQGEGKVIDMQPLNGLMLVEIPGMGSRWYSLGDIQPKEELAALQRKAEAPYDRPENGHATATTRIQKK